MRVHEIDICYISYTLSYTTFIYIITRLNLFVFVPLFVSRILLRIKKDEITKKIVIQNDFIKIVLL